MNGVGQDYPPAENAMCPTVSNAGGPIRQIVSSEEHHRWSCGD